MYFNFFYFALQDSKTTEAYGFRVHFSNISAVLWFQGETQGVWKASLTVV